MRIRLGFGRRSTEEGDPDGDPRSAGVVVLLLGVGLAWLAIQEGHHDLLAIALVMAASGAWLAGLYRLVRGLTRGRAIVGGLFTGWAVVGAAAAAWSGYWVVTLLCAALLLVGLLVLGVIPLPARAEPLVALVRRLWFGFLFMGAGLVIVVGSLGGAVSEGTPPSVGVVAGAVFFLGGLLFVIHKRGSGDTVVVRTFNALLITGLAACAIVLPPTLLVLSLVGTVPFVVLAWIAVARLVIERRTGRDPLGTWSDQRVLGLGCGLSLALVLLVIGGLSLRSCLRRPRERPPAEAPALSTGLGAPPTPGSQVLFESRERVSETRAVRQSSRAAAGGQPCRRTARSHHARASARAPGGLPSRRARSTRRLHRPVAHATLWCPG